MATREEDSGVAIKTAACLATTIAVVVVATMVVVTITSKIKEEGCNKTCRQVATVEAVVVCSKEAMEEDTIQDKVVRTRAAIKTRITTTRPSNANSLIAAGIVLTGISAPLPMDNLNFK